MYRYSQFSLFASRVARTLGHPITFMIFLGAALLWLATGPIFHFSGTWYSAYSNMATIVTTLLLFLIQHTQSREIASIQFKLNEIIRVSEGAHNSLLDIEEMTDRDYDQIKASYTLLAQQAREQLQSGKVKWATARVSMESHDSFLDPTRLKENEETEETVGENIPFEPTLHRKTFSSPFASSLERVARIATYSGHAPMALAAIHDREHHWLQRGIGFEAATKQAGKNAKDKKEADGKEVDGEEAIEREADEQELTLLTDFLVAQVVGSPQPVVVPDMNAHPLFHEIGARTKIAAFAAIPLLGTHQKVIGCLAVLDRQPREWSDVEIAALQDLAGLAVEQVSEYTRQRPLSAFLPSGGSVVAEPVFPKVVPALSARGGAQEPATVRPPDAGNSAEAAHVETPAQLPGTILVVDDSASNRTLLQRRLLREGYTVLMAANGQEALACLHTEPVGLILLDVMMPEMDGEEVLQRMQADDRLRQIPVIMVTALDEKASVQRCLQAGAKDYLLKPFDPVQLRAQCHFYLSPRSKNTTT